MANIHLLGIRHHGPGSSKQVLAALAALQPEVILIEGPPETAAMMQWINNPDMQPPVALLAYVPDQPQQAVFYPFAAYSPEWNAVLYALQHQVPYYFIDLPLTHALAYQAPAVVISGDEQNQENSDTIATSIAQHPLAYIAEIAGFEDTEEWWEHHFELYPSDAVASFEAIAYLMENLRETFAVKEHKELLREAFMRKYIRAVQKDGYQNIAVICGAWHVPALKNADTYKKSDEELLKNLPKIKVESTWIPWTNERMMLESGYGAGIVSPGWYEHLWQYPTDDGTRWLSRSAAVFRRQNIDISAAHVIEAARLAQSLAALRGLSRAGLKELNEAILTVMCMGDSILLQLIYKELQIGNTLGQIPEDAPQTPLQRDFDRQSKKLHLKPTQDEKKITLDLREPFDNSKSIFLHRLLVLNVTWGKLQQSRSKGTFKEEWLLNWQPEYSIHLLEKTAWGNTIEAAANKYVEHLSQQNNSLADLAQLAQNALPAELHEGIRALLKRLDELAASTSDLLALLNTFVPLAQLSRYGNVRKVDMDTLWLIVESVFYRMTAALPYSVQQLTEEPANELSEKIRKAHHSVLLLDNDELKENWWNTLERILTSQQTAPLIHGTCCKLLYDQKVLSPEATALQLSRAFSVVAAPEYAAFWLEGFLHEGATLLLYDETLWHLLYEWLQQLSDADFLALLPLLRRTFALFSAAEKRKIAQKVARGNVPLPETYLSGGGDIDDERAQRVLPILEKLLLLDKQ